MKHFATLKNHQSVEQRLNVESALALSAVHAQASAIGSRPTLVQVEHKADDPTAATDEGIDVGVVP